jgi:hypothetical protein
MLRRFGLRALRSHSLSRNLNPLPSTLAASRISRASTPTSILFQYRGKKTKTTVKLSDLPQGLVSTETLPSLEACGAQDEPVYPTVVLQARRNMQKFGNCVLLTRVGGFYELYFEHAEEYGPLLNIKVASKRTSAGPVPMVISSHAALPHSSSTNVKPGWFPLLSAREIPEDIGPGPQSLRGHR